MLKILLKEIFNPIGIIFGFVISIILDRIIGNNLPFWCYTCFFLIWLAYYIFSILLNKKKEEFDKELAVKDATIETLTNQTRNMSLLLADKISVFSKNVDDILLKEIVRDFTVNNKFIDGLQLYCYDASICQGNIKIKCNSVVEFVRNDYELNTVSQIYYNISFSIYQKIKDFYFLISEINKENLAESTNHLEPRIKNMAKDIIDKICEEILYLHNKKTEGHNTESELYHLEQSAYSNLEILDCLTATLENLKKNVNDVSKPKKIDKEDKEDNEDNEEKNDVIVKNTIAELKGKKRTGMLGCILTNDIYLFHNEKSKIKYQRKYMCFPFIFRNKKMIASFAVSKNLTDTYRNELSEYVKMKHDFIELVLNRSGTQI